MTSGAQITGVLLAAGSGRRFGRPKALVDVGSGPWVLTSLRAMAGCDELVVVIGASAADVRVLVPEGVRILENPDHLSGMGSSLRTALEVVESDAALVMLVDLPDVTAAVIDRVAAVARTDPEPRAVLARAGFGGRPGHPVLIGSDHFAGVMQDATGDAGARSYLEEHPFVLVECADLAGGADVDDPAQL